MTTPTETGHSFTVGVCDCSTPEAATRLVTLQAAAVCIGCSASPALCPHQFAVPTDSVEELLAEQSARDLRLVEATRCGGYEGPRSAPCDSSPSLHALMLGLATASLGLRWHRGQSRSTPCFESFSRIDPKPMFVASSCSRSVSVRFIFYMHRMSPKARAISTTQWTAGTSRSTAW